MAFEHGCWELASLPGLFTLKSWHMVTCFMNIPMTRNCEPRRLEASDAHNQCWIEGIQQVNNELGYQDHTSMSLDSCWTSSWKKPVNIGGSQTVEFRCLHLSTSNQYAERNHLHTRAGKRSYLVCTHTGCIAENREFFFTRISNLPDTCKDYFRPLSTCVGATGRYCSLWSTRLCNVISRQNVFCLCDLVINKWSLYIRLSATALSHDDTS